MHLSWLRLPGTAANDSPSALEDRGPIRGEALSLEDLESRARILSSSFTLARNSRISIRPFFRRLRQNEEILRRAHEALAGDVQQAEAIPPAAEWLLDNYNLVESEILDICRNLPRKYYLELPKLAPPGLPGTARVYAMALELIRRSDARLDSERLERFVAAFQAGTPLTMGELWAWPIMLKAALVETLRRLASELLDNRASRIQADRHFCALEVDDAKGCLPAQASTAFLVQLFKRMREHDPRVAPLRAQLEERLSGHGVTPEDAIRAEHQWQANLQVATGNAVTSLRFCSSFDWTRYFERVSLVEQVLKRDPAGVYAKMDFGSRDRYRHAVEELAAPTGEAQVSIALRSIDNARHAAEQRSADAQLTHVGYCLIGKGRRTFEREVSFHRSLLKRLRGAFFAHSVGLYLGAVAALTTGLVLLAALAVEGSGTSLIVALLALLPASEAAIGLTQW